MTIEENAVGTYCFFRNRHRHSKKPEDQERCGPVVGYRKLEQRDSTTGRLKHERRMFLCDRHIRNYSDVVRTFNGKDVTGQVM